MSQPFGRTLASLASDRSREASISLLLAFLVVLAWGLWAHFDRVPLYEVSAAARLEAGQAPHPLEAPMDGRLAATFLEAGRFVRAGEVLVQIEAGGETASRREAETRLASLERELLARRAELNLAEQAAREELASSQAALAAARARLAEAEATVPYLAGEAGRLSQLADDGLVAPRDAQRGSSEAERQNAAAASASAALELLQREEKLKEKEREARRERLRGDLERLEGEALAAREGLARFTFEVDRRALRAPIDGIVAEKAERPPGAFVTAGERLAVLVPDGELIVVAQLAPAALGRVEAGQLARLELLGFPAAQYGLLEARVQHVSGELRDGTLRAELVLLDPASAPLPLRHGMPARVEIEVERLSPLELGIRLLRSTLAAPRAGRGGGPS